MKDLCDSNIKPYYKLVSIDHMRDYSINNYLDFNLSYKLIIDHILVDYKDKQINKTNLHKLNNRSNYKGMRHGTINVVIV
jgi:phage-related holin